MKTVLLTAFEPFDRWTTNCQLAGIGGSDARLPDRPRIVTRRYPVDFSLLRARLEADLQANYDFASPGPIDRLVTPALEAVGINFGASEANRPRPWSKTDRSPIAAAAARRLVGAAQRRGNPHGSLPSRRHLSLQCDAVFELLPGRADGPGHAVGLRSFAPRRDPNRRSGRRPSSLPTALASSGLRLILGELAGEE